MARTRTRSRSRDHWYPSWVYSAREDITRANMDRYDREMDATRARCLEINPEYRSLPWLDRQEVWTQARKDLGLSYLDIDTGRIMARRKEATK
jgi:hypothetical protein